MELPDAFKYQTPEELRETLDLQPHEIRGFMFRRGMVGGSEAHYLESFRLSILGWEDVVCLYGLRIEAGDKVKVMSIDYNWVEDGEIQTKKTDLTGTFPDTYEVNCNDQGRIWLNGDGVSNYPFSHDDLKLQPTK